MISSFSFLYLRSCDGDSVSFCSWFWMSCSCRRRSFLYSVAILSKVSTTFGFSSASMAASDIWFSNSSSSMSRFGGGLGRILFLGVAAGRGRGAARNGVADGGAAGRRDMRRRAAAAPLPLAAAQPAGRRGRRAPASIAGFMLFLASGPA